MSINYLAPSYSELNNAKSENSSIQFANILGVSQQVNHSNAAATRRSAYDDPIIIAEGCINSNKFGRALSSDIRHDRSKLNDTINTSSISRKSYYYRFLNTTVASVIEDNGTSGKYDAYVIATKDVNNLRSRTKTFARHWYKQIEKYFNQYNEGNNYVEIKNEETGSSYVAFANSKAGIIYSAEQNRLYIIFSETPNAMIRSWLRKQGLKTAGTTLLWYKDAGEITGNSAFSDYVNQFIGGCAAAWSAEAQCDQVKTADIESHIVTPTQEQVVAMTAKSGRSSRKRQNNSSSKTSKKTLKSSRRGKSSSKRAQ